MSAPAPAGRVWLVGAGPGDPGLITVAGLRALEEAVVGVFDRLVDPRLVDRARPGAELVFAGKSPKGQTMSQQEINTLLVERARAGYRVCRLKGGDPFVFGRGGEEAAALAEAGVRFDIVPGVTSAVAVPAYAGIPVTHRGVGSMVGVLTGHGAREEPAPDDEPGEGPSPPGWAAAAASLDTAVFLMGAERLPEIASQLLAAGRSPDAPAAVIQCGTLASQRTITAPLGGIAAQARAARIAAPAVLVVGEVVLLRDRLRWFDTRPLSGRRVLVTRPRDQAGELADALADLGAEPVLLPVLRVEPLPDPDLALLDRPHDWILFTSVNGVRCLAQALRAAGRDVRGLGSARLGAIGEATAAALEALCLRVEYVPTESVAEGMLAEFPEPVQGQQILLARAREGRDLLPETLRQRGAAVEVLPIYETVPEPAHGPEIARQLEEGALDAVTFSSGSAVRFFRQLVPDASLAGTAVVCIGPATAEAAFQEGLTVTATARDASARGMAAAVADALAGVPGEESDGHAREQ